MQVIRFKVTDEQAEIIEEYVEHSIYDNTSEFIREVILLYLEEQGVDFPYPTFKPGAKKKTQTPQ